MSDDRVIMPPRPKDDGLLKAIFAGVLAGVSAALTLLKMSNRG